MNKNNISISKLYSLFLLLSFGLSAFAQGYEDNENYYSNPKKGINPAAPRTYNDTSVTSKSDDITVELTGIIPDTSTIKDTTPNEFQLDHRSLQIENQSLLYSDPWYRSWYASFYDPWYYHWSFDPWIHSHCWSCHPYWGWRYSWYWDPYWGWDPFWDYGWYHSWYWNSYYYAYYTGWHHPPYHGYTNGFDHNAGYGFLNTPRGNTARSGRAISPRNTVSSPTRGTVRRGGVDLNNGGRAPHGRISGTGTVENRKTHAASAHSTGNNSQQPTSNIASRGTSGRYAKPAAATAARTATAGNNASRGSMASRSFSSSRSVSSSRSSFNNSRNSYRSDSYSSPSRNNSSFRTNSSSSRPSSNSSIRNSSPSRSASSSSFRSTPSSRSSSAGSFRSAGSPRGRR